MYITLFTMVGTVVYVLFLLHYPKKFVPQIGDVSMCIVNTMTLDQLLELDQYIWFCSVDLAPVVAAITFFLKCHG
jgi:hypothetical protein